MNTQMKPEFFIYDHLMIYAPKREDEHPPFLHLGVPPPRMIDS